MNLRHRPARMVLAVGAVLVALAPASQSAASGADIVLSPSVGPPTTVTRIKGTGFSPGEEVAISFDSAAVASGEAGVGGGFSLRVRIPRSALPGHHVIGARGRDSERTARARFIVRTDWPMFHFSLDRTGHNPYENVLGPDNVDDLEVKWAVDLGWRGAHSPAVVDGVVYIGTSDGNFFSLDAADGSIRWVQNLGDLTGAPAVVNGRVYVGSSNHVFFCLDATTGRILWRKVTGYGIFTAPAVNEGVVFFGSNDDTLYARDALTGQRVWEAVFDGGARTPAVAGGMVYSGNSRGTMHAFDIDTGDPVWTSPDYLGIDGAPAVAGNRVYFGDTGTFTGGVVALDIATGEEAWRVPIEGQVASSPAVWDGVVYIGSEDKRVWAVDAETGEVIWRRPTHNRILSSPAVANGVVYIGSLDRHLYALDAKTGRVLKAFQTGGAIGVASPAVADGVVYIASGDQHLYALHVPG